MDGFLEVDEACQYLKISKVTLFRYARDGIIPAFKMGRKWRFHKCTLNEWMLKRMKEETTARSKIRLRRL